MCVCTSETLTKCMCNHLHLNLQTSLLINDKPGNKLNTAYFFENARI